MNTIDLRGTWHLSRVGGEVVCPVDIPGDIMTALMKAKIIEDPYRGMNETLAQWAGREAWILQRRFDCPPEVLTYSDCFVELEHVDTFAEVSVNETVVGSCSNMFLRNRFNVAGVLQEGENTISISLRSAELEAERLAGELPYPIPHTQYPVQSQHRNLVRKTQCHAGWDWGPCLMTCGIYGNAAVYASPLEHIEYVHCDLSRHDGTWHLTVTVELHAVGFGETDLNIACATTTLNCTVALHPGQNIVRETLDISAVEPWWPAGCGQQPLYRLAVTTSNDHSEKQIGFRIIEVDNTPDGYGTPMTFRVNGRPIFCKGANWIPAEALPGRTAPGYVEHLLRSAVQANMNMLRVWGGGQYESDEFYNLCDRLGLLVWQDFMFSCALYPSQRWFTDSVKAEVTHQVKRLKDHPCLALWCGNNEDIGALTWFDISRKNRDRYLVDYDRLNERVIGETVKQLDPNRRWWSSSPSAGEGDYSDNWHDDSKGDMHYWSVWHEGKPFEAYKEVTPRFCSEFGFQSFPSLELMKTYYLGSDRCADEHDLNIGSPVLEHHQRNDRGNSIIITTFTRYFRFPVSFAHQVYLSQVQQAMAIATAVEYWRSRRPLCMGTLYWQLNDTWPAASWSSLEYGGKWKALHYEAARIYAPFMITFQRKDDGEIELFGVNDTQQGFEGRLTIDRIGFDGSIEVLKKETVSIAPEGSTLMVSLRCATEQQALVRATFESTRAHTTEAVLFLDEPKRCELHKATVTFQASHGHDSFAVMTDKPAFFVMLDIPGWDGHFSDNCFHLFPDRPKVIELRASDPPEDGLKGLHVTHLRDTY